MDEKEYCHAFLIVEARKGTGGSYPSVINGQ